MLVSPNRLQLMLVSQGFGRRMNSCTGVKKLITSYQWSEYGVGAGVSVGVLCAREGRGGSVCGCNLCLITFLVSQIRIDKQITF